MLSMSCSSYIISLHYFSVHCSYRHKLVPTLLSLPFNLFTWSNPSDYTLWPHGQKQKFPPKRLHPAAGQHGVTTHMTRIQWRAVHGSKGSIASVVKKRTEKNSYINTSIFIIRMLMLLSLEHFCAQWNTPTSTQRMALGEHEVSLP
jgi:hypothetical protein